MQPVSFIYTQKAHGNLSVCYGLFKSCKSFYLLQIIYYHVRLKSRLEAHCVTLYKSGVQDIAEIKDFAI